MSTLITFVLGGAYSGKSEFVMSVLNSEKPAVFYVTGAAQHEPLKKRYEQLQKLRTGISMGHWETQFSSDLSASIKLHDISKAFVIDCTYNWLSSLIINNSNQQNHSTAQVHQILEHEISLFVRSLESIEAGQGIIVSTDIGSSLPSANPYERLLREVSGKLNQKIAHLSNRFIKLEAGCPILLKD